MQFFLDRRQIEPRIQFRAEGFRRPDLRRQRRLRWRVKTDIGRRVGRIGNQMKRGRAVNLDGNARRGAGRGKHARARRAQIVPPRADMQLQAFHQAQRRARNALAGALHHPAAAHQRA